jgi:diadenosine tetraphosphate (Ap4A) HIT family hydrolase
MRHPWVGIGEGSPVHELAAPVVPEPPRSGEGDGGPCFACLDDVPAERVVHRDELWRVFVLDDIAFAGACMLVSQRHADGLSGLDAAELASLGPLAARITKALEDRPAGAPGFGDGRVGRVHAHLWNDGGAHFHMWFLPRPLGYLDLRGSALVEWEEVLPRATEQEVLAAAADLRSRLQGAAASPVG